MQEPVFEPVSSLMATGRGDDSFGQYSDSKEANQRYAELGIALTRPGSKLQLRVLHPNPIRRPSSSCGRDVIR